MQKSLISIGMILVMLEEQVSTNEWLALHDELTGLPNRRRFDEVSPYLLHGQTLSEERKLLLGGYFTHEYSLEAAALFNPSMVPHPDQSDVPPGSLRFILSLRATAEGHVSSIAFRTGLLNADNKIAMDVPS